MKVLGMKLADKITKMKGASIFLMNALMLACAFTAASQVALAETTTAGTGKEVIGGVLSVVYLITNVLGILFVIIGFVKLVISHAQEDAPGQQKAAMFIATGLVLILLRIILGVIKFEDWIDDATDDRVN